MRQIWDFLSHIPTTKHWLSYILSTTRRTRSSRALLARHCEEGEPGALVKRVARTTQNIAHFMAHEFFYCCSGGGKIFTRIEFFWVFSKGFADCSGHGQA